MENLSVISLQEKHTNHGNTNLRSYSLVYLIVKALRLVMSVKNILALAFFLSLRLPTTLGMSGVRYTEAPNSVHLYLQSSDYQRKKEASQMDW